MLIHWRGSRNMTSTESPVSISTRATLRSSKINLITSGALCGQLIPWVSRSSNVITSFGYFDGSAELMIVLARSWHLDSIIMSILWRGPPCSCSSSLLPSLEGCCLCVQGAYRLHLSRIFEIDVAFQRASRQFCHEFMAQNKKVSSRVSIDTVVFAESDFVKRALAPGPRVVPFAFSSATSSTSAIDWRVSLVVVSSLESSLVLDETKPSITLLWI